MRDSHIRRRVADRDIPCYCVLREIKGRMYPQNKFNAFHGEFIRESVGKKDNVVGTTYAPNRFFHKCPFIITDPSIGAANALLTDIRMFVKMHFNVPMEIADDLYVYRCVIPKGTVYCINNLYGGNGKIEYYASRAVRFVELIEDSAIPSVMRSYNKTKRHYKQLRKKLCKS